MSKETELLTALLNGETVEDFTPRSRMEAYLKNCCLACGCDGLPEPITETDKLLLALAEKIAGGGGSSGGGGAKVATGTLTLAERVEGTAASDSTIVEHNLGVIPSGFFAIVEFKSSRQQYDLNFMLCSTILYYTQHYYIASSPCNVTCQTNGKYLEIITDPRAEATTSTIRLTYMHEYRNSYALPASCTIRWMVWG